MLYKLTPMQMNMLIESLRKHKAMFISYAKIELFEMLDYSRLQKSVNQILNNYEIMRCSLVIKNDEYFLKLHDGNITFTVHLHDLSNNLNPENEFQKISLEIKEKPIKLNSLPLMEVNLFKFSEQRFTMFFSYPHFLMCANSAVKLLSRHFELYDYGKIYPAKIDAYAVLLQELDARQTIKSKEYWQGLLQGAIPSLLPRLNTTTVTKIALLENFLTVSHANKIKKYCHDLGITPNIFFQTVLAITLSKFTNNDHVVFGTTRSFDPRISKDTIGLLINIVPILFNFSKSNTIDSVYTTLKEQHRALKQEGYFHVQELLYTLNGQEPLFNVMFDFKPLNLIDYLRNQNSKWQQRNIDFNTDTNHDCLFEVAGQENSFKIRLNYLIPHLSENYATSLFNYFLQTIEYLLVCPLDSNPLELDQKNISNFFNFGLDQDKKNNTCPEFIINQLEHYATHFPNQIAIYDDQSPKEQNEITYKDLWMFVKSLSSNVQMNYPDIHFFVIYSDRCKELVVGLLSALYLGKIYVPIDISFPPERVKYILEDTKTNICFITTKSIEDAHNLNIKYFKIDIHNLAIGTELVIHPAKNSQLAYMIYTSGTTGVPKGALNFLESLNNRLLWMKEYLKVMADDVILQKTPLSFDVSIWELLLPIISGSKMIIAKPKGHLDARYLMELQERYHITIMHFVPSVLKSMMSEFSSECFKSLRSIVFSGEALPQNLCENLLDRYPSLQIYNFYGPTEAAIDVTAYQYERKDYEISNTIPIGYPISNVKLYVLDRNYRPVPPYAYGELFIGNVAIGAGYHNLPKQTQENYIINPFSSNEKIYKTGDLVIYTNAHLLYYLGRQDSQIKILGVRIELEEINKVLIQQKNVSTAISIVEKNEHGQLCIISYIVIINAKIYNESELRRDIAEVLPQAFLPVHIIVIKSIPLTYNGKLDQTKLPRPTLDAKFAECLLDTPSILFLQKAIQSILNTSFIPDPNDHLISLGLHSLLVAKLAIRIQQYFNVELTIDELFKATNIIGIDKLILQSLNKSTTAWKKLDASTSMPLSDEQTSIFLHQQQYNEVPLYNMPACFIVNNIAAKTIILALEALCDNHQILRMGITLDKQAGQPIQKVTYTFNEIFTPVNAYGQTEESIIKKCNAYIFKQMEILDVPLCKIVLYSLSPIQHILFFMIHHINCDGVSINILINSLEKLLLNNEMSQINTFTYLDYVNWQKESYCEVEWQNKLANRCESLCPRDPILMPNLQYIKEKSNYGGARKSLELSPQIHFLFKQQFSSFSYTPFIYLLGIYAVTLSFMSGEQEMCLGVPTSGRYHPHQENMVGLFVNLIPITIYLENQMSFNEILFHINMQYLEAMSAQKIPYQRLVMALRAKNPENKSLIQAIFNLTPVNTLHQNNKVLKYVPIDTGVTKYDIKLEVDNIDPLSGYLEYRNELFNPELIDVFSTCFTKILHKTLHDPSIVLSEINLTEEI